MALVRFGGAIGSIRGKVGNAVFQQTAAGIVLRYNQSHPNKRTIRQVKVRAINSRLQSEWLGLTPAQRNVWQGYRRYNPIHQKRNTRLFINGHQAFLKINHYRLMYNLTVLLAPQFNKCELTPIDASLSLSYSDLTLTLDRAADATNEFVILFVSVKVRPTKNNPGSLQKMLIFTTTNTNVYNINAEYLALFGIQLIAGNTIFFKWTNASKNSGRIFPFKQSRVTL